MIQTKKDLAFYIAADRIMNGYQPAKNGMSWIKESFLMGGGKIIILRYLESLRKYAYYSNNNRRLLSWNSVMLLYYRYRLEKLSLRCGFSIGTNSLGYGVVIPHYGTIVVNENARIGNYAVLHTCTCVAGGDKVIGDGLYLSTGSQIVGSLHLGNSVTIAAHSLVNKSFENNVLIVGAPGDVKRDNYPAWYDTERDRARFSKYIIQIENIRKKIYG